MKLDEKGNLMRDQVDTVGGVLKLSRHLLEEIKEYRVIIGFSGFGNVGYLALTHLIETLQVESIAFWGHSSWYHRNNLESLITAYRHKESKTIIIVPRIPIHVSTISHRFWDQFASDVLKWNCRDYIIVGGLREDTRSMKSAEWAAYVPTPKWKELYNESRTFGDHLAMIGPLSSFIVMATVLELPLLGLLAYCNFEEDPEAAIIAVKELNSICNLNISDTDQLVRFDYSFIPGGQVSALYELNNHDNSDDIDTDDDEDDIPGYDLNDLV